MWDILQLDASVLRKATERELMARFVDMWVFERIKFTNVPLWLLLFDLSDLRAQWADPCLGITESRVRASVLSMYANHEISILNTAVGDDGQPSAGCSITVEDENLIRTGTFDEISQSKILITMTAKGLDSWARWCEYDWNIHTSFESDEVAGRVIPGWLKIRCASWEKLLFEIIHSPDRSDCMLKPSVATCIVTPRWSICDFKTLPWCFYLRSPAFDINLASDVDLETSERDVDKFCASLADAFAKWDQAGRTPVPFEPLSRLSR